MSERIKYSAENKRDSNKKRTYFLACGSNVDGRLGIGGNNEGCQTQLKSLAPFHDEEYTNLSLRQLESAEKNSEKTLKSSIDKLITENQELTPPLHEYCENANDHIMQSLTISCGRAHTLCISEKDGHIYGWGSNDKGQLCGGKDEDFCSHFQPTKIDVEPYLSHEHCHLHNTTDGHDKRTDKAYVDFEPSPWSLLKTPIATLACGYNHSLIVTAKGGQIYSFGENTFGQLGLNDTINRRIPTHVSSTTDHHFFVSVAGGSSHSLALTIKGDVYSFGRGAEGQLGDGISGYSLLSSKSGGNWGEGSVSQLHKRLVPGRVEGFLLDRPVIMIAASQGGHGSYAVTAHDGYGWRWGALDKEIPHLRCEDSYDDINSFAMDEDKNIKTEPFPLPPPLGNFLQIQRDRASSAPTDIIASETDTNVEEIEMSQIAHRRGRRSASFDLTSEFVRNAATTATATLANLSTNEESPPISPGSSMHLFPGMEPRNCNTEDENQRKHNPNDQIIALSAGAKHLICVTRAGEAFAMGSKGPHLGLGPACRFQWIQSACKMLLPGDVLINGVSCGERHTLLSSTDGRIFVCGDGRYGMLGVEGKDLELASCDDNAVPKSLPFGLDTGPKYFSNIMKQGKVKSNKQNDNDQVIVSTTVSESSLGCKTILHYLQTENDNEEENNQEAQVTFSGENPNVSEDIFHEDDEDYWGEEGLGHELEIDFNMRGNAVHPFGKSEVIEESWKNRLSRETRRRLSSGTKAVGGVIFTTGGAVINTVVSAVKSGIQTSDSNAISDKLENEKDDKTIEKKNSDFKNDAKATQALNLRNIEYHHDSFDGLVGSARCRVLLAAGSCHSCVNIVYDVDE